MLLLYYNFVIIIELYRDIQQVKSRIVLICVQWNLAWNLIEMGIVNGENYFVSF